MQKYKNMRLRKKYNVKMIRNLIFFLTLIVFTFCFIFKDQSINELIVTLNSANIFWVLLSVLLTFCVYLIESINIRNILVFLGEKKLSIKKAFKFTSIGAFFSAITPASTGGQPIEIYYMSKEGIQSHNGTLAMLIQLCGFQISTIFLSLLCAVLNPHLLNGSLFWFYILGITINGIALLFMLLSIFSRKLMKKIFNFIIKIMKKTKSKNIELKIQKLEKGLDQYSDSARFIKNNKMYFFKSILCVLLQIIVYHSVPFFIYKSFGLNSFNYFELFSIQAVFYTTISGIPLPGSIGVSETLFLKLYGIVFGTKLLSGAMLLYRFSSFYLFIIIFLIIVIINAVKFKNIEGSIDKDVKEIEISTIVHVSS